MNCERLLPNHVRTYIVHTTYCVIVISIFTSSSFIELDKCYYIESDLSRMRHGLACYGLHDDNVISPLDLSPFNFPLLYFRRLFFFMIIVVYYLRFRSKHHIPSSSRCFALGITTRVVSSSSVLSVR